MSAETKTATPNPTFINELLDHRLVRETVSVTNSAAQTTKTTTYPKRRTTERKVKWLKSTSATA